MHTDDRFKLFSEDEPRIGVIIGTGPSLTQSQLDTVKPFKKFGCNNAIFDCDLDVHLACNYQWWDYYWPQVKDIPCHQWTTRPQSAERYGVNYIEERWEDGISTDKDYICAHHGSGPQIFNLAYHYGVRTFILIGWDMRHKGKRHYFGDGEYPKPLQHFTKALGPNGELLGLINEMATIKPEQYGIQVYNCTPGSAMTCFEQKELAWATSLLK